MKPQHSRLGGASRGKSAEPYLDSQRRQFYFWAYVLAVPAIGYGFWVVSNVQRPALVFILLNTLVGLYLLTHKYPVAFFERICSLGLAGFTLVFIGGSWFVSEPIAVRGILETGYWLYFLNLVVMHLLLPELSSWRIRVVYNLLFLGVVLGRVWPGQNAGDTSLLTSFGSFFFTGAATAVVLNVLGAYRVQLVRENILATTDALTGALNRRPAVSELERLTHTRTPFAVILFDVDHFKAFNDRFGHFAGDTVLFDLVRLSEAVVGKAGLVARWGGEEFLVVLGGCTEAQGVDWAEVLRSRLERATQSGGDPITASFGVAVWTDDEPYRATLTRADRALYRAKHEGRNRVVAASSKMEEPAPAETAA